MKDLLDPISSNIWQSVPSNNFPIVHPCSYIGKDSSPLILLFLDLTTFPNCVVLKSEFHQIL